MTEPRIISPEEAREWITVSAETVRKIDLAHTVVTEPDRIRAAVVTALRGESKRCGIALRIQLEDRAYAIENGAPL